MKNQQKILFRHIAGSKLYGTNLPTSDTDYKEIYLPSPREILLGRTCLSGQTSTGNKGKNTSDDEDVTRLSLQKFLTTAAKGDVGCLETLFADSNQDCIIYKDPLWDKIVQKRSLIVSKSVDKAFGYMRNQVNRYVVRGSRANAVKNILKLLEEEDKSLKLDDIWDKLENLVNNQEFSSIDIIGNNVQHINICNRKAPRGNKIGDTYNIYKKLDEEYGARTRAAQNLAGKDWKGIAHCLRIGQQMVELIENKDIKFPRENSKYLKDIRTGNVPIEQVTKDIDSLFEEIESFREKGDYKNSMSWAESISEEIHLSVIAEYLEHKEK
jgi:predicted nucleotidyltransferase